MVYCFICVRCEHFFYDFSCYLPGLYTGSDASFVTALPDCYVSFGHNFISVLMIHKIKLAQILFLMYQVSDMTGRFHGVP
jgi:hypothetical protein